MSNSFYHVTFSLPCRSDGIPEIHQARDTAAFNELRGPVERIGYNWGSEMLLYIYRGPESPDVLRDQREDFSMIDSNDCLVMTTRPPMSDEESTDRRIIGTSESYLEKVIFNSIRPYISKCCRSIVELNPDMVAKWALRQGGDLTAPPVFFSFHQHRDARIKQVKPAGMPVQSFTFPDTHYSSVGFFLHLPAIPEFGCRLIVAWGMGGKETAAWCRIVRKRFPKWFDQPRFAIGSMDFVDPPRYPLTLDYADDVGVDVLLDYVIDEESETDGHSDAPAKEPAKPGRVGGMNEKGKGARTDRRKRSA